MLMSILDKAWEAFMQYEELYQQCILYRYDYRTGMIALYKLKYLKGITQDQRERLIDIVLQNVVNDGNALLYAALECIESLNNVEKGFNIMRQILINEDTSAHNEVILAAAAYSVTVQNVVMYADILVDTSVNVNVGGFFGASTNCVVSNCALYGSVSGVSGARWINAAGFSANPKTSIGHFTNCVNYADIQAVNNTTTRAGGIIGYAGEGVTLTGCYNFGNLSVADNNGGQNVSTARLGGIIAENAGKSVRIYDGCFNFGLVESPQYAGGILGFNCSGKAVTIRNCVNYGEVKGSSASAICGFAEAPADVTLEGNAKKNALAYTPATGVKTYGVQNSEAVDGSFNVRFVGTLDSLDYLSVGFEITAYWQDSEGALQQKDFAVNCKKVYQSITGKAENGIDIEATAQELGGEYIFALALLRAPAAGTVTFVCRSVADTAEGTVYGNAFACAFEDGVFLFCADAQ